MVFRKLNTIQITPPQYTVFRELNKTKSPAQYMVFRKLNTIQITHTIRGVPKVKHKFCLNGQVTHLHS
jgi:hypothetical protein